MSSKKRQQIPTILDSLQEHSVTRAKTRAQTLAEALTPRDQHESWAVLAALRFFVLTSGGGDCSESTLNRIPLRSGDHVFVEVLRAMLARSEGME